MDMKLLDLHTAEYFNDNTWYYGKDTILLKQIKVISACKYVAGTGVDPLLTRYEKPRFNGIEFLEMNKQPHTDPIVNRLAEKVGAVIYGGRYVLLNEIPNNYEEVFIGDVIMPELSQSRYSGCYMNWECFIADFYSFEENIYYAAGHHISYWRFYIDCNIFEEFAKKEQGLENKFDELYNLIYGK